MTYLNGDQLAFIATPRADGLDPFFPVPDAKQEAALRRERCWAAAAALREVVSRLEFGRTSQQALQDAATNYEAEAQTARNNP